MTFHDGFLSEMIGRTAVVTEGGNFGSFEICKCVTVSVAAVEDRGP